MPIVACLKLSTLPYNLLLSSFTLGAKVKLPSCPVQVGIVDEPLVRALQHYDRRTHRRSKPKGMPPKKLRYVLEVTNSIDVRQDVPIDWQRRQFGSRCVDTQFIDLCISQT